jgi:glycerophosphoryl diester phosphodiesterase
MHRVTNLLLETTGKPAELGHAPTDGPGRTGKLVRAQHKKCHKQDDQDFYRSEVGHAPILPGDGVGVMSTGVWIRATLFHNARQLHGCCNKGMTLMVNKGNADRHHHAHHHHHHHCQDHHHAHDPKLGGSQPSAAGCQDGSVSPRLPSLLDPPIGFAHRGARSHAPDNTLESFSLALRLGAKGLESDVWITANGQAVLDHDGVVGSPLRRRRIAQLDRNQLPDHIPTLTDLYELCGPGIQLSLDVKDPAAADEVVATARNAGAEARLWLCHPDLDTVASWRRMSPTIRLVHSTHLAALEAGPERHAADLARRGVDAVNLHHREWTGGNIVLYHRFEVLTMGWDAQFERVLDELLDAGIDAVFSDHVDRMVACLDRIGG